MAVITISRQFGAGGKTLGERIAKQLGYTFADSSIIEMIAKAANVSPTWVETVEQEAGTRLTAVINKMVSRSLVDKILKDERGYIDETLYLDYLVVMIAQLAEEGNVIILGRGSQYILNDHPDAYHVLLINEFENRVAFMESAYEMSREKAERTVRMEEKRRLNLYRKIHKRDYDSPSLYHMVLNMGRIDLETAEELILRMVERGK